MAQRCSGNGLIIPREWTTVGVGLALLAAGLARRVLRGPDAT